jgi:hypothetical protein
MESNDIVQYVTITLVSLGVLAGLLFWMRNLLEDVHSKITGIWTNSDNTFRVLIYNIDSVLQGDVVWANDQSQRILGKSVLQQVKLRFFFFGRGVYTCPFTHLNYNFRLRLLSKESMQLYLTDKDGKVVMNETWKLFRH